MHKEFSPEGWLNYSPPNYNAWKVVEDTARLVSRFDTMDENGEWHCNYWQSPESFRAEMLGRCEALTIMSEIPHFAPVDWEQFIVWYATDHYCQGKRVVGWTIPDDDSPPQPIF